MVQNLRRPLSGVARNFVSRRLEVHRSPRKKKGGKGIPMPPPEFLSTIVVW
jgi:hypothetical protein